MDGQEPDVITAAAEAYPPLRDEETRWLAAMLASGFAAGGMGADIAFRWSVRDAHGAEVDCLDEARARMQHRWARAHQPAVLLRRTVITFAPQEIPDETGSP